MKNGIFIVLLENEVILLKIIQIIVEVKAWEYEIILSWWFKFLIALLDFFFFALIIGFI